MTHPPPSLPSDDVCAALRHCLGEARFTEVSLRRRLAVPDRAPLASLGSALMAERVRALDDPARTLVELFLLERTCPASAVDRGLGARATAALRSCGLIRDADGGSLAAAAHLGAVGELVFASDLAERHRAGAHDFVLGAGGATRRFADLTLRAPVHSVLDLGSGAGVLAALAAAHAERVVGTDVNARAVAFARFNAELNGLDHVTFREGSLYEPVAGERFDLVVCNPPFAISPTGTFAYRDGGSELSRAIARHGVDHLNPGGRLQMMAEWPERTGVDWRAEVLDWLDGVACDAWVLRLYSHDATDYAWRWVAQDVSEGAGEEALREWVEHLRTLGVDSVGGGLLALRHQRGSEPVRHLSDAPPLADGPVGASLGRWLRAQELLAAVGHPERLLDVRLVAAPGLERTDLSRPAGGTPGSGWSRPEVRLRLRDGLHYAANVDPVAATLVGLLADGGTPREALAAAAGRHGLPEEPLLTGLPSLVHRLLSLGILLPVEGEPDGA